jgi:XTP/dITP diphosphohydrolase
MKMIGDHGFGYDPIFIPDGSSKTFAQMEVQEKNCFSHRGKSLDQLIKIF